MMITGGLLLDKKESIKQVFVNRVLKILVLLTFIVMIYILQDIINGKNLKISNILL